MEQNKVSQRAIEVFKYLKSNQIIENQSQFAKKIGMVPQSFSQVIKGKRDLTVDNLSKLFIEFNIDPAYVFSLTNDIKQYAYREKIQPPNEDIGANEGKVKGKVKGKVIDEKHKEVTIVTEPEIDFGQIDIHKKYFECQERCKELETTARAYEKVIRLLGGRPESGSDSQQTA